MRKVLLLIFLFVTEIHVIFSQTKIITGTVIVPGQLEGPVSGATVIVKRTSTGTITDLNGKYLLPVPVKADTLVFSYVGMKNRRFQYQGVP